MSSNNNSIILLLILIFFVLFGVGCGCGFSRRNNERYKQRPPHYNKLGESCCFNSLPKIPLYKEMSDVPLKMKVDN